MKLMITSYRGHHEAVLDVETSELIFNKITGKSKVSLPDSLKSVVPDTFKELEDLWKEGTMNYIPFKKNGDEIEKVEEFNAQEDALLFLAPVVGG